MHCDTGRSLCISAEMNWRFACQAFYSCGNSGVCTSRLRCVDRRFDQANRPGGTSMSVTQPTSIGILFACALALTPKPAVADEGGVSFWVPGFFGSLAAAPQQPGWSFTTIYYHTAVSAGADVAFARQVHPGNIQVNFTGNLNLTLKAPPDIQFFMPSY